MAKLTTKARKALATTSFADPKDRKFPIETISHARNALARIAQGVKAGRITATQAKAMQARIYKKWPSLKPSK